MGRKQAVKKRFFLLKQAKILAPVSSAMAQKVKCKKIVCGAYMPKL